MTTPIPDEKRLRQALGPRWGHLGIRLYPLIDSTNDEGARLCLAGEEGPLLLVAEAQSAGRGRGDHAFFSPAGKGLYFTLLLPAPSSPLLALRFTPMAAVACAEAIETCCGVQTDIKWVNDIYRNGKKLGGILCQLCPGKEVGKNGVLVGIGLNLQSADYPAEFRDRAAALDLPEPDREALLGSIVGRLLELTEAPERSDWMEAYRKRSLVIGKRIRYNENGREEEGVALDLDENGALLVRKDNGQIFTLSSGEIGL